MPHVCSRRHGSHHAVSLLRLTVHEHSEAEDFWARGVQTLVKVSVCVCVLVCAHHSFATTPELEEPKGKQLSSHEQDVSMHIPLVESLCEVFKSLLSSVDFRDCKLGWPSPAPRSCSKIGLQSPRATCNCSALT